ncbi:MAG: beta-1,4-xylanase, partial [Deltaproteobacteria bacterium]
MERRCGEYDFSGYDMLLEALEARDIRPLFILDYGNPLYDDGLAPHTDRGRAAFAEFAYQAAACFRGRG